MPQARYSALFLDRDGVINERLPGEYVAEWAQFRWCPGNPEAIAVLEKWFKYVFVVTNQQGVGKGLMTQAQLENIHGRMQQSITEAGGRIDRIFCCTDIAQKPDNCRKPSPEMGFAAKAAFPGIDFSRSYMVGDSLSDLQFGQALGMNNVLIRGKAEEEAAIQQAMAAGLSIQYKLDHLAELQGHL